jgi:hypothetical protein
MPMVTSKNALPTAGAIYITIRFKVMEIKNKSYVSDGNSKFVTNVRASKKYILNRAIWNAVKKEFPTRSVTPYDILILEYHYTYYLDNYQIVEKKNKYYERYRDKQKKRTKYYAVDKEIIKDAYVGNYNV